MSPGRVSDAVMEASKTSAAVSSLAAFLPKPPPLPPILPYPSLIAAAGTQRGKQVDTWIDKAGLREVS